MSGFGGGISPATTGRMPGGAGGTTTRSGFGATSSGLRAVESDALIESSFRRMLASLEQERDQIRGAWQKLSQERDGTTSELERIRQETEDWCYREKQKIEAEWERLNKLSEDMAKMWPENLEVVQINCANEIYTLPKETLCGIPGSALCDMFSDDFIQEIPRDEEGRFYLDFNPKCFGIIVEYLRNRRLRADAPLPLVPAAQIRNMEILAEAWKLRPFIKENRMNPLHGTSLQIIPKSVEDLMNEFRFTGSPGEGTGEVFEVVRAVHPGWQVIGAHNALPVSSPSYFEMSILKNPDAMAKGGLAVGICNHIPTGPETHSVRLECCVLYNSSNGVIGDALGEHDVKPGLQLKEGDTVGVRHDVASRTLQWFYNRTYIGTSTFKDEFLEHLGTIYPVFGLYNPNQTMLVDFRAAAPDFPGADGR